MNGQIVGEIGEVSEEIKALITSVIKATIVSTIPDGHCLRRSIAKSNNMNPGQVIKKLRRKCTSMLRKKTTMLVESDVQWYEKVRNFPDSWTNIKSNQPHHCPRSDWGGINEIQMWAMIIGVRVIVIDKLLNSCTPSVNAE